MTVLPDLPVTEALPALDGALAKNGAAVLIAPPGAGKTTLVPLHLLGAPWRGDGRIVLLEPRRLAARAAAARMASLFGEAVGETVGTRMRLDSRIGAKTRIEVVTEGVFARMALDDPELSGVSAVLFDEYHERSLDADFGLALALDIRAALRPDLRLLVMSATLDGARVAASLGDAPVVESAGRAFPVELRYVPRSPGERLEDAVAQAIRSAAAGETGSILAFLPGQAEILRTQEQLQDRLPANCFLAPLFGQMEIAAQDRAIRPAPDGARKIVLATSIAETSITIDGVRVVVDSGYARLPRFEPGSGVTRLETVRVSKASADQRAGRAGRTAPGVAIRLWSEAQTAALVPFHPPEIFESDLSRLLLDCLAWGVTDPAAVPFPDPPPRPALIEARALLTALGAIDADGRLTAAGRAIRALPLPVRLAHMVAEGANRDDRKARAELAVLLTEQGLGGVDVDLERRLDRFRRNRSERAQGARRLATRLAEIASVGGVTGKKPETKPAEEITPSSVGSMLADAWPDRIAAARGARGRYVMANGRGAILDETDPLAASPYLVVADLTGSAAAARIRAAAALTGTELGEIAAGRMETRNALRFGEAARAIRARRTVRLGAITLEDQPAAVTPGEEATAVLLAALRQRGLSSLQWPKAVATLRRRLAWLHDSLGSPWPDVGDEALAETLEEWLLPFAPLATSFAQVEEGPLGE
ncbi:MAG TPA: ATP-dependent helicase HrpB, partial [Rhizobiaceae bacterium]|nr:ATP-dependent helicase HrpB [Rhizobiaceae bacterium]